MNNLGAFIFFFCDDSISLKLRTQSTLTSRQCKLLSVDWRSKLFSTMTLEISNKFVEFANLCFDCKSLTASQLNYVSVVVLDILHQFFVSHVSLQHRMPWWAYNEILPSLIIIDFSLDYRWLVFLPVNHPLQKHRLPLSACRIPSH